MGERFAEAANLRASIGYDAATMEALFRNLIAADTAILLITEGGAAGGILYPAVFNAAHLTGQELFWWVDPEHRGTGVRLLAALEDAARAMGAKSWTVSTMESLNHDGAAALYRRRGYVPTDRNYIKAL